MVAGRHSCPPGFEVLYGGRADMLGPNIFWLKVLLEEPPYILAIASRGGRGKRRKREGEGGSDHRFSGRSAVVGRQSGDFPNGVAVAAAAVNLLCLFSCRVFKLE